MLHWALKHNVRQMTGAESNLLLKPQWHKIEILMPWLVSEAFSMGPCPFMRRLTFVILENNLLANRERNMRLPKHARLVSLRSMRWLAIMLLL